MAERGGKLRGALAKDPGYKRLPGKPGTQRTDVKPSMGREGNMANKPTQRLSPGVYRSAGGGLVTQGGRQIQRPTQPPANWTNDQMLRNLPPGTLTDFANRYNNGAGARIGEIAGNVAADQQMDPGYFNPELQQITNRVQNILANQQPQSGYMPNTQGTTPPGWNNLTSNPGASVPQFDPNNPGQIQNGLGQPMTMPQMPQASANQGGRYRLSPGVYGTQQQAMNQYNQQMGQFNASLPQQLMKKY
jgi:hypothetical protein